MLSIVWSHELARVILAAHTEQAIWLSHKIHAKIVSNAALQPAEVQRENFHSSCL